MIYLLLRAVYGLWFLGVLVLVVMAIADLLFGSRTFADRLRTFFPRIAISVVWPLAILTPKGRYLVWTRWRNQ